MVSWLSDEVVLGGQLAPQLPGQLTCVCAGDLEHGQAADLGQQRVAYRRRERVSLDMLRVANRNEAPCLPSSESIDANSTPGIVCISATTTIAPWRSAWGSRSSSRMVESIRLGWRRRPGRPRRALRRPGRSRRAGCRQVWLNSIVATQCSLAPALPIGCAFYESCITNVGLADSDSPSSKTMDSGFRSPLSSPVAGPTCCAVSCVWLAPAL